MAISGARRAPPGSPARHTFGGRRAGVRAANSVTTVRLKRRGGRVHPPPPPSVAPWRPAKTDPPAARCGRRSARNEALSRSERTTNTDRARAATPRSPWMRRSARSWPGHTIPASMRFTIAAGHSGLSACMKTRACRRGRRGESKCPGEGPGGDTQRIPELAGQDLGKEQRASRASSGRSLPAPAAKSRVPLEALRHDSDRVR